MTDKKLTPGEKRWLELVRLSLALREENVIRLLKSENEVLKAELEVMVQMISILRERE